MIYDDDFCNIFRRRADAVAFINGSKKYPDLRGTVYFFDTRKGVMVKAEIAGLPKGNDRCSNPIFAFHIHDGTECNGNQSDPFAAANGHFNPYGCPHPEHAGDLPPLFGVNGEAYSAFLTDRFSVFEVLGKAIIIHRQPDDFTSQPAGNAGEKIACGIITPTAR